MLDSQPKTMYDALSFAKQGEAYTYRIHEQCAAIGKRADVSRSDDISEMKSQIYDLTQMMHNMSSRQALVSFKKYMPPPSSLLQGKHLSFIPSPLRLNIFHLFVILSLTQLYRYTPEIFLFSTATFKYTYRDPLRRIGQDFSESGLVKI
jgi:hypothetical protein